MEMGKTTQSKTGFKKKKSDGIFGVSDPKNHIPIHCPIFQVELISFISEGEI